MEVGKYGRPSTHVGGPRQQNHHVMKVSILNNRIRGKSEIKKDPSSSEKKTELELDELQAQAQQME